MKKEINTVVASGTALLMLPFFESGEEIRNFLGFVGERAKIMLLFETPEAVEHMDEILALEGTDKRFIGLNDLHLSYHGTK